MSKKEDKNHPPRQGSVSAEDNGLMEWLHRFWARKEPPEKLEVWLLTGPAKDIRASQVYHVDFKPHEDRNQEQCAHLANEIIATAQHDSNTTQRKSTYEVAVVDRHRSAHPIVRRLGPLLPEKTVALAKNAPGHGSDDDDDETTLSGKPMALLYIDRLIATLERERQGVHAVIGDILLDRKSEIGELRMWNHRLQQQSMEMFMAMQEALDRKEDRADRRQERMVARARDELIADGMREAGRLVKLLLPGVVDAFSEKSQPQSERVAMQSASSGTTPELPDYGDSRERYLVENFLRIISEVKNEHGEPAKLDEALLGDWVEEENGDLKPNPDPAKAGIFAPDQVRLLIGVSKGWLAPDRVDELMPDWGHPNAITGEQLARAQAIVPQSAAVAVFELLGLRTKKREAANQTATNTAA
jgi:hypothetical protein